MLSNRTNHHPRAASLESSSHDITHLKMLTILTPCFENKGKLVHYLSKLTKPYYSYLTKMSKFKKQTQKPSTPIIHYRSNLKVRHPSSGLIHLHGYLPIFGAPKENYSGIRCLANITKVCGLHPSLDLQ